MATVGTSVVASKLIAAEVEPFAATALRHLLALPVLLLLCGLFRPVWPRPCRHDALVLLVQAASGSVGYTVLLIAGTSLSSAADAGVVAGTLPAMAALFAILILGELPGRTLGIALVTAAVACEVIFILGQRRLRAPIEPLAMATLMSAGGLVLSLPVALAVRAMDGSSLIGPSTGHWAAIAAIAWYAWAPTVLGFWLWYAGARRATATQAAASTAWLPLVAVVGAAVVLDETLTAAQLAALALVLAGVIVGSIKRCALQ